VTAGVFSTLQWNTTGATSVSISPALPAEDNQALALSGNAVVVPQTTTTYTATATGPGGTASATATVTVTQPPATISFSAMPDSIIAGQPSTLSWTATNATALSIDNGVGTGALPTGSAKVYPTTDTTYTATVTGKDGKAITAMARVTVQQQLAVTLSVNPDAIGAGQTSTLTWTSQGASAVRITPVIAGCAAAPCTVNLSGSAQTPKLSQTTIYSVTAEDMAGDTKSDSKQVTVVASNGLQTLKHIIFFMQENRSFDNYFGQLGAYKASKGLANDVDGTPAGTVQYDSAGAAVHPYHYQTICAENSSPSWNPSWGAYDLENYTTQPGAGVGGQVLVGGTPRMDGFVTDKDIPSTIDPEYHRVMGYYDQSDLPYYYEAASQFASSDRWHSSVMAGTIPNRMYLFTGSSSGHIFPDPPPVGGWPQKTIFQLLNQYGISWRYYYQDNSVFLAQFAAWNDPAISGNVYPISNWYTTLASASADSDLPSVIFIERASETALDEHPGANVQAGAADAVQVINALLASQAWKSSVLILTWDEFSGLYDHVPPMAGIPAPDNINPIASTGFETPLPGDFVHSGFRVPLIVFSPWVKAHFVSHQGREFTSILKLIETRFGLPALTARDAWADDMSEFFDFSNPSWLTPPPLPAQPTNGTCDWNLEISGQN